MTRQAEVRTYFHSTCFVQFHPELLCDGHGGNACGPYDGSGVNNFAAVEFDFAFPNIFDTRGNAHMDAQRLQLTLRALGQVRRQMAKHSRPAFNEDDLRLRGVNVPKIAPQNRARQFGARAANSTPVGPAPMMTMVINFERCFFSAPILGPFKSEQDFATDAQGVVKGFEPGRELFPLRMSKVPISGAQRQDHVIVFERIFSEQNLALGQVEIQYIVHQNGNVAAAREDGTNGLGDFGRGKLAVGHLIQQRLEQMVIHSVHQCDARVLAPEIFAVFQAPETAA